MTVYEISSYEEAKEYVLKEENERVFEYRGFKCRIKRISILNHLCGYIEPVNARLREVAEENFHGGITYDEEGAIGFDCAHAGDMLLTESYRDMFTGYTYKTMNYVESNLKETIDLVRGE